MVIWIPYSPNRPIGPKSSGACGLIRQGREYILCERRGIMWARA